MMKVEEKMIDGSQRSHCLQVNFSVYGLRVKRRYKEHTQTHYSQSEKTAEALREVHSDADLSSQVEVIKSRKPIKKMINIHVGDAASTCRWDGLTMISHTHR